MRVLLVGHGGREHALAWRIAQSPTLTKLIVVGQNPGWPDSVSVQLASGVDDIVALAQRSQVDLCVVGPEAPLADGLADALASIKVPTFGPSKAAALLESSKAFAKEIMAEAGVPTASCIVIEPNDPASLQQARERCDAGSVVIKADGLAAGKGVYVCPTAAEAHAALDEICSGRFGNAAERLVLEELLTGPEVSVFALSDGQRVVALPSAQDHKRLLDGDEGPNTGGMGAYAPCPLVDDVAGQQLVDDVHQKIIDVMARRGTPYRGVLYGGFMMTPNGPRVLEFNVRFGDPECQVLMALWDGDILPWLYGAAVGELPEGRPVFANDHACVVVLASAGYPRSSDKGQVIPEPESPDGVVCFFAGTKRDDAGSLRTNGGRVLGVTARGESLEEARALAYDQVPGWRFTGSQVRADIASKGLGY